MKTLFVVLLITNGMNQSQTDALLRFDGPDALKDCKLTRTVLLQQVDESLFTVEPRYEQHQVKCLEIKD